MTSYNRTIRTAAQTVKDAAWKAFWSTEAMAPNDAEIIAAAALRAAVDHVAPDGYASFTGHIEWDQGMEAKSDSIREAILAIADELEAL